MKPDSYDPVAFVKTEALMEPDAIINWMIPWWRAFVSMFTVLADFVFRPLFGSRVLNPVRAVAGWVAIGVATILGILMEQSFAETDGPERLIGMSELFSFYNLLMLVHVVRVYRLMLRLDLESDSLDDGPSLFYKWFPNLTWTKTRMLVEPACILFVALVLNVLDLAEPSVLIYLVFVAQMLFIYALTTWYGTWLHLRESCDNAHRSKVMMQVLKGHTSARAMNPEMVARMGSNVPVETRVHAARIVTGLNVPPTGKADSH